MKSSRWMLPFAATTVLIVASVGCYGPTEVRLELSSDLGCSQAPSGLHTGIYVGEQIAGAASVAEFATPCANAADLGSLVIVPSGARDARVTVEVALATDGSPSEKCHQRRSDGTIEPTCIVARRSFRFIEHTSRPLPIALSRLCLGQTCASSTETCVAGRCQSADVDAPPDTDGGSPTIGSEASADAGDAAAEAAVAGECVAPDGGEILYAGAVTDLAPDVVAANTTQLFWAAKSNGLGIVRTLEKKTGVVGLISSGDLGQPTTIAALAADADRLWIGTNAALRFQDLGTGKLDSRSDLLDGVTATVLDGKQIFVSYTPPTLPPAGPPLYTTSAATERTTLVGSHGGDDALAVTTGAAPALYGTKSAEANVYRHALPWANATSQVKVIPTTGRLPKSLAAGAAGAYVALGAAPVGGTSAAAGIFRIDDADVQLQPIERSANAETDRALVVDGNYVYFVKGEPGASGVYRVLATPSDPPPIAEKVTAPNYPDVHGLIVDTACIYYWVSSTPSALHVQRKPAPKP